MFLNTFARRIVVFIVCTLHMALSSHLAFADGVNSKEDIQESQLSLTELKEKYPDHFIFHGSNREKTVALTFDDVPDPRYTGKILDILKSEGVPATFFVVGYKAEAYPSIINRMLQEGHELGNHTYNHPYLPSLSLESFQSQIDKTDRILMKLTGKGSNLFRPPYGEVTEEQLLWMIERGMSVVNWNVDSLDWKGISSDEVIANIFKDIGPGAIVLQHAGGGEGEDLTGTIQALPQIIAALKREGYTFLTVSEMVLPQLNGIPRQLWM